MCSNIWTGVKSCNACFIRVSIIRFCEGFEFYGVHFHQTGTFNALVVWFGAAVSSFVRRAVVRRRDLLAANGSSSMLSSESERVPISCTNTSIFPGTSFVTVDAGWSSSKPSSSSVGLLGSGGIIVTSYSRQSSLSYKTVFKASANSLQLLVAVKCCLRFIFIIWKNKKITTLVATVPILAH